jgi:1-deoxy-D-xylulose-5-phosphate synthase
MALLDRITNPADVRKLKTEQLPVLARELREYILDVVSRTGGHLAPSLGVVELTLALHYVFDTASDRLVWDVGHQAYVHKILSGRREAFHSLRQYGGISGFPMTEESPYDAFNTGHSSTSISAALGMALARDIQNQHFSVIAVTGDGALTGGMTYEALNNAGNAGRDLTVILNDNEMSISKNVGAMSSYLNRLRTDPSYARTKDEIEGVLSRIPGIGHVHTQTVALEQALRTCAARMYVYQQVLGCAKEGHACGIPSHAAADAQHVPNHLPGFLNIRVCQHHTSSPMISSWKYCLRWSRR